MCSTDIFLGIIAILFPPFAVWVKAGICSADSLINILLCMLGYLPGLLHAWYIIAKFPDPDYTYSSIPADSEAGPQRVTYVYVTAPSPQPEPQQQPQGSTYGSIPSGSAAHQESNGTWTGGPSQAGPGEVPPTYAEAVAGGGHKIQTQN